VALGRAGLPAPRGTLRAVVAGVLVAVEAGAIEALGIAVAVEAVALGGASTAWRSSPPPLAVGAGSATAWALDRPHTRSSIAPATSAAPASARTSALRRGRRAATAAASSDTLEG
jgi:hypothetical protein